MSEAIKTFHALAFSGEGHDLKAHVVECCLASDVKARDEALDQVLVLMGALEELIEVADLRGDSDLPHPADDPKLWTARMIDAWDGGREALSNTSTLAAQRKREIEKQTRETVWEAVKDMWGASPMQFRAAILNPEGPDANTEGA